MPANLSNTIPVKTNVVLAEQFRVLRQEVEAARAAYEKAAADQNSDLVPKLWETYYRTNDALLPKAFELARQEPASATAFEICEWIVKNGRISLSALRSYGNHAVEFLRDHHTTNPKVSPICGALRKHWNADFQPAMDFLRKVAEHNPDRGARGHATLVLAILTEEKADEFAFWESQPPPGTKVFEQARAAYLEAAKKENAKTITRAAEELFQNVLAQYADCPVFDDAGSTLGNRANVHLYEMSHLSLGRLAPELAGEDLEGKTLKLSDYRGKVVVLNFWASWCGPCMQMVPLERALVEQMKGRPFTLLGVNGDENREEAQRASRQEKMSWPSFWNGTNGPDGPLATAWNVRGWPTVYVLDPKGVIRLKFSGYGGKNTSNLLTGTVDRLMKEFDATSMP